MNPFYIAVDFDGTIAKHRFPNIGDEVPHAFDCLHKFREAGAELILWTMRSDNQKSGDVLQHAIDFCSCRGIQFKHVNCNPQAWTTSHKAYAHIYIDDAAFGCPLIYPANERPYVDWKPIGSTVLQMIRNYYD